MAFTLVAICYVLSLFLTVLPIVLMIWHIIAFDELKSFNENPIHQCKILNPLVLPEYLFHGLVCAVFFCTSQWLSFVLNMPLIAYHVWRYMNRPLMSNPGLYDPTSIMNADVLAYCQYEGFSKLLFYMLTFCYYMYRMIYALVIS